MSAQLRAIMLEHWLALFGLIIQVLATSAIARSLCPATSAAAIVSQAKRLEAAAAEYELPLSLEASFFLIVIGMKQCDLGISGAIGEIGSTWPIGRSHAKECDNCGSLLSISTLSLLRRDNESLLMVGPFVGDDDTGFDSAEPLFGTGTTTASCISRRPRRLHLLEGRAATQLMLEQLIKYSDGPGYRLIRLDRCRDANETHRLLFAAAGALVEGGVLLVEGLQGVADRPGVQEAFHRFMLEVVCSLRGRRTRNSIGRACGKRFQLVQFLTPILTPSSSTALGS